MEIEVGQIAFLDGWDTENGTYLKECIVEAIVEGQAKLQVIKIIFDDGRALDVEGEELTVDKNYLELPLEERVRNQKGDVQWFIDQFTRA